MKTEYKGVTVHVMRHFYANSELKDASLIPDRSVVLALLGIIYKMGFCLVEILAISRSWNDVCGISKTAP